MVTFAENVYLWRIFRGLSQEKLAERSGIPRPNISAIEKGKREVSLATLRALAANLETTPGSLVNGVPPMHFKQGIFSRKSLEAITRAGLTKNIKHLTSQQRDISILLSGIIRNRINANDSRYKDILKARKIYVDNWLMLKATIGQEALNSLLARIDKYVGLGRYGAE